MVVAWVGWSHFEGGIPVGVWYPSAIAAVGLLAVTIGVTGRILPAARAGAVAIAGLASLTAYSYMSIKWAPSPADGWEASNKLLLLLAVAWTISLLPWNLRAAQIAIGGWVLGVTGVCASSIIAAAAADDVSANFIKGRYLEPIGYANAAAALPAMALIPALWLCTRRNAPAPLRVLFFAVSVFLAELAALPQSRGAVGGLLVSLVVFVALAPNRMRLIAPLAVVAGALAVAIGPIYDVYSIGIEVADAADRGVPSGGLSVAAAVDGAARVMAITAAAAAALGCLVVAADAGLRLSATAAKRARQSAAIFIAAVALVGLVAGVASAGRISDGVSDRWQTFKSHTETPATKGARLTANYADQRYDFWRVALRSFVDAPVTGGGAASFEHRYSAQRRFEKPFKYAHSIWMRLLAEGGLAALALLLVVFGAGATGLRNTWRRCAASDRELVAVCAAIPVYFLVHASVDWLEEFPALASPALALPFVAIAVAVSRSAEPQRSRLGAPAAVCSGLVAVAAVVSLALPYAAQRHLERRTASAVRDLPRTYDDFATAASLNPLSPQPPHLDDRFHSR